MQPFFSIVVTIYNLEKYIKECVNSLLCQDFKDYEIILVDDGSTDNSSLICDNFQIANDNVFVIHKKNSGVVSSRIAGTNKARGKYILYVDGDDLVEQEYLSSLHSVAVLYNPDCICFSYSELINDVKVRKSMVFENELLTKEGIAKKIYPIFIESSKGEYFDPSLCFKAIKSDLAKKCQEKMDENIKIGEDFALSRSIIYNCNSIYMLNKSLYCYRMNITSATKGKHSFPWTGPELIARYIEKEIDLDAFDFNDQLNRNIVHNLFNVVLSQFNKKENYRTIKGEIVKELNNEYYVEAVNNCYYDKKYFIGNISKFLLKYRFIFIIRMIAELKQMSVRMKK